jgi:D-3-phosphoglycerate dehydrogenase
MRKNDQSSSKFCIAPILKKQIKDDPRSSFVKLRKLAKILVSDPISEVALDILDHSGIEYEYKPEIGAQELLRIIPDFDVLIVRSRTKVTKELIEKATSLSVIGRAGVGLDNIDVEFAKEKKIKIVNTPDALTNAVAEFTIGLMFCLARQITAADSSMRQGKWQKNDFTGTELRGKAYGTIGIGRIGARVSELAFALGMSIMANDIIPIPQNLIERLQIRVSTVEEIFTNADFVDLHVPLTKDTTHLANFEKFSLMKKSAYIINTSRGKVLSETDLIRALKEGKLAGAALDVFETEPLVQSELQRNTRVVLTPHIAGQTEESQTEAGRLVVELVLKNLN